MGMKGSFMLLAEFVQRRMKRRLSIGSYFLFNGRQLLPFWCTIDSQLSIWDFLFLSSTVAAAVEEA